MYIKKVSEKKDWQDFLTLPQRIYANDPNYVEPLQSDIRKQLSPQGLKNQYCDFEVFILLDKENNNQCVGRIVAAINHRLNENEENIIGLFGYFECIDNPQVEQKLLQTACNWSKEHGAVEIRGPINLTTHTQAMFLLTHDNLPKNIDPRPAIMMPYNPKRYYEAVEREGFQLIKKAHAYNFPVYPLSDTFQRAYKVATRSGVTFRPIHIKEEKKFLSELEQIYKIFRSVFIDSYSSSWQSKQEFFENANSLQKLVDPSIFPVAEYKGEIVGFFMTLPDYNQILHRLNGKMTPWGIAKFLWYRRSISHVRAIAICVKPEVQRKMVALALIHCLYKNGIGAGYKSAELSWIWEDNHTSRRITEAAQATVSKEYGLYQKKLMISNASKKKQL